MDRKSVDWEGYFLALVTPFTRAGDLDERAFRDVVELAIDNKVDGIVPVGCTGEWWTLTDEERVRLYRIAAEQTRKRVTVVAGTAAIATSRAIAMTKAAKEVGCDGAVLTAPPYALPREREIITFFQRISDAVDFPLMLYNNPNRVRRDLTPELVSTLADIENVVAIKDSSGDPDKQEKVMLACKERIRYLKGGTSHARRLVPQGCEGFVDSAAAHLQGSEGSDYYRACKAGEWEKADGIFPDSRAKALHDMMWIDKAGMFPASLKEAMNMLGRPGGYPREPLLPLDEEERQVLRSRLVELGLKPVA